MMKNTGYLRGLLLLAFVLGCQQAFAVGDPVGLNVTGNIVASPCIVDTDTQNKTVDFGKVSTTLLKDAAAGSEWQDFTLLVKDCPAATTKAKVTFSGNPDAEDDTAFDTTGTAQNLAIRLASRDRATVYANNSVVTVDVNAGSHTAEFPLSARVFSPTGNPGVGIFESILNLTFTYQ